MKINVTLFLFCCDLQGWTMKPVKGRDLTTQTCKSVAIYKSFYFFGGGDYNCFTFPALNLLIIISSQKNF